MNIDALADGAFLTTMVLAFCWAMADFTSMAMDFRNAAASLDAAMRAGHNAETY